MKPTFWDDEAQVGIIAKNLAEQGKLTGWDGRNLYAYRNGTLLDEGLRPINPPLDYLLAAASFKIFKPTTFAGRFPFVLAGLSALIVFGILLRLDFGKSNGLWVYAFGILAFSTNFLLNIRQCRYYALALLFSTLVFLMYRLCLIRKDTIWFVLLGLSSVLLFYSNWFLCASFLLALGAFHVIFQRRSFDMKSWIKAGGSALIFLAATVPYAIHYRIWIRHDMAMYLKEPWLSEKTAAARMEPA